MVKTTDPRVVGGVYWCAYWRETYTVTNIENPHGIPWFTVVWHGDGGFANSPRQRRVTTHCTPWDNHDQIISGEPLEVRAGQHCTSLDCPYTFSHTGEWCGYKQVVRCPCPFCYQN